MMKIILVISILGNLVLGYLFITKKPEKEIIERERLIIETHAAPAVETTVEKPKKKAKKIQSSPFMTDQVEMEDIALANDKVEEDKTEFFTRELGASDDKLARHNRLRDEFYHKQGLYMKKFGSAGPSFEQRKEMIELEEEFYQQLEKLHGKKNWDRYLKYRDQYNNKGYEQQMKDGKPFIFMNL